MHPTLEVRVGVLRWTLAAVVVLALGAAAFVVVGRDPAPGRVGSPAAAGQATGGGDAQAAAPLSAEEARRLETALSSQDPAEVTSVFAEAVAPAYADNRDAVLPPGSSVTVQAQTFVAAGGTANVELTVAGPAPGRWLLVLVLEADQWRAVGTRPL